MNLGQLIFGKTSSVACSETELLLLERVLWAYHPTVNVRALKVAQSANPKYSLSVFTRFRFHFSFYFAPAISNRKQ